MKRAAISVSHTPKTRSRQEVEARSLSIIEQLDMMMQARATLIAMLDCDDRYRLATQMRAYLADYRAAAQEQSRYARMNAGEKDYE